MYIYIYGRENSLIVEDRYYYSCIPLACLYEKIFGFGRKRLKLARILARRKFEKERKMKRNVNGTD